MTAEIAAKQMDEGSPILMRIFKEESGAGSLEAEIGRQIRAVQDLSDLPLVGELGPKVKEGDRQAPEGFYTITPGLINPNSNYYLAFNTGFPKHSTAPGAAPALT